MDAEAQNHLLSDIYAAGSASGFASSALRSSITDK